MISASGSTPTGMTDSDGVNTTFSSGNVLAPVPTNIRWGRFTLIGALGSELIDLQMPVKLEIYDGGLADFIAHSADTCTAAPSYTVTDPDPGDALVATTLTHSISSNSSGTFILTLDKPGLGNRGAALVTLDAPSYLEANRGAATDPEPSATGSFGFYSGRPYIIFRQLVW